MYWLAVVLYSGVGPHPNWAFVADAVQRDDRRHKITQSIDEEITFAYPRRGDPSKRK